MSRSCLRIVSAVGGVVAAVAISVLAFSLDAAVDEGDKLRAELAEERAAHEATRAAIAEGKADAKETFRPLHEAADGLREDIERVDCLGRRAMYTARLEGAAGLPDGWLAENVFGKREEPNWAAFETLPKSTLRKLVRMIEAEPRPPSCDG